VSDPTWVTVTEAAHLAGISRSTMWRLINRHDLQTAKYSGDRRTHIRRVNAEALRDTPHRSANAA